MMGGCGAQRDKERETRSQKKINKIRLIGDNSDLKKH